LLQRIILKSNGIKYSLNLLQTSATRKDEKLKN